MSEKPTVTLLMTTYAPDGPVGEATRTAAKEAMDTWFDFLTGCETRLHVADDGSTLPGYGTGLDVPPATFWGMDNLIDASFSRQERRGIGASLNAGLAASLKHSPLVAFVMDDWRLTGPLDLAPWCALLEEDERIGCVRLGPPHPTRGKIEMSPHGWVMQQERDGFAFSLRPALYHKRFFDFYGPFVEGVDVGTCEEEYNRRYCGALGPECLLALYSPFEWTYQIDGYPRPSLAGVTPGVTELQRYVCARGHVFDWPDTHPQERCPWLVGGPDSADNCGEVVQRLDIKSEVL